MLKFTNTLSGKIEEFVPLGDTVGYYSCGPTVYDFAHIGNMRKYLVDDILHRTLKYMGFKVKMVMNLTDVDDKTIAGAQKEELGLIEYTSYYTTAFREDMASLNIIEPDVFAKATEHIPEMVEMINKLLKKGIAYKAKDGIYFNISKYPAYGKLSKQNLSDLKSGARVAVDNYDKENAGDFVLWKFWTEKDGEVFWDPPADEKGTELGKGRPGWHIECSAMSTKYLGQPFDIHTGGEDLIFPHHENEIAQSEAANDKPFVKYFLHNGMIMVDGKKMSKSLGNYYTLRDVLNKEYDPMAFRLLTLMSHYRAPLNFTFKALDSAADTIRNLKNFMWRLNQVDSEGDADPKLEAQIEQTADKFKSAIKEDLQTPQALAAVFELISAVNVQLEKNALTTTDVENVYTAIWDFDKVLGIFEKIKVTAEAPKEIQKLAIEREKARAEKNFERSDKLRKKINEAGWEVEDTSTGPRLKKV